MNPRALEVANRVIEMTQKESSFWKDKVSVEEIPFEGFGAQLIYPVARQPREFSCLVYFHGGGLAMKAAKYHKNLVRQYAYEAEIAVLFVDYRLIPKYRYPIPLSDCLEAYRWAAERFADRRVFVAGDSAGGNLAAALILKAEEEGIRIPDRLMLVYPALDSRMNTPSMEQFTDTPLWNAKLGGKMWELYTEVEQRHDMLVSPAEAPDSYLARFPETYIETAEFDCLRDEGIAFAQRLQNSGVEVHLHKTEGTIHGFDIEESSAYVKECVSGRIQFLRDAF